MDIKEELRLIREGCAIEDDPENTLSDDNLAIYEAAYDLMVFENAFDKFCMNESAFESATFAALMLEAAVAVEEKDNSKFKEVLSKIKDKLISIKNKFDPIEGLHELKAANDSMTNDKIIILTAFIPVVGPLIGILAIAAKYKNIPYSQMESYISEANTFKAKLDIAIKAASASGDKDKVAELKRQYSKLESVISAFMFNTKSSRIRQMDK